MRCGCRCRGVIVKFDLPPEWHFPCPTLLKIGERPDEFGNCCMNQLFLSTTGSFDKRVENLHSFQRGWPFHYVLSWFFIFWTHFIPFSNKYPACIWSSVNYWTSGICKLNYCFYHNRSYYRCEDPSSEFDWVCLEFPQVSLDQCIVIVSVISPEYNGLGWAGRQEMNATLIWGEARLLRGHCIKLGRHRLRYNPQLRDNSLNLLFRTDWIFGFRTGIVQIFLLKSTYMKAVPGWEQ